MDCPKRRHCPNRRHCLRRIDCQRRRHCSTDPPGTTAKKGAANLKRNVTLLV